MLLSARSTCVGSALAYKYGDQSYRADKADSVSATACLIHAAEVVDLRFEAAPEPRQPAIGPNQPVFAMSYYYDRGVDIG